MKKGISTQQLAFLAFAAVINIIGGYIALFLHLPIYLDSIGTILISAVLGPIYGICLLYTSISSTREEDVSVVAPTFQTELENILHTSAPLKAI